MLFCISFTIAGKSLSVNGAGSTDFCQKTSAGQKSQEMLVFDYVLKLSPLVFAGMTLYLKWYGYRISFCKESFKFRQTYKERGVK